MLTELAAAMAEAPDAGAAGKTCADAAAEIANTDAQAPKAAAFNLLPFTSLPPLNCFSGNLLRVYRRSNLHLR